MVLLIIPSLLSLSIGAEKCESCHSGSDPDGEYIYEAPSLIIDGPSLISPNESFRVSFMVKHFGEYDIKDLKATMDLSAASGFTLDTGEECTKELADMDRRVQTHGVEWKLKGPTDIGSSSLNIDVSYTANYPHTASGQDDSHKYKIELDHVIEVVDLPFTLDPTSFKGEVGKTLTSSFIITALEDIYHLEIALGLSISDFTTITPSKIGTLRKGQTETVSISMSPDRALEHGTIVLIWSSDKDATMMGSVDLGVTISAPQETGQGRGKNLERLTGRALGFVGLILMVVLAPTGGTFASWRKKMNKVFGKAKRRIMFHCAISYTLFTVTLLHAALLMYGHYRSLAWNGFFLIAKAGSSGINLGAIALLLMFILSLLGIFQKRLIRPMGHKNWKRVHGWLSWVTIVLIVVHLLMVGTTFGLPLRTMLNI